MGKNKVADRCFSEIYNTDGREIRVWLLKGWDKTFERSMLMKCKDGPHVETVCLLTHS